MDHPLSGLSRYVYGTTRLGDESIPSADRVAIARKALDSGLWLHTSDQYGNALNVLKTAFSDSPLSSPKLIVKVGWSSAEEVKGQIESQAASMGLASLTIGQLCPGGPLADDLQHGGAGVDGLRRLIEEGLVRGFVMEMWPWTSDVALGALKNRHADGLVEALIFYFNPLQRFVTNELWDFMGERKIPFVAMRTVCGGDVRSTRDNPNAPEYLRRRAADVAPIFERSGAASWTEFAVRFALGFPQVLATVGSTARVENLGAFLSAAKAPSPLESDIVEELLALQRLWSNDHDRHAAPWSM